MATHRTRTTAAGGKSRLMSIVASAAVLVAGPAAVVVASATTASASGSHPGRTQIINSASTRNLWTCSYKKSGSVLTWTGLGLPKAGLSKAAMSAYWASRGTRSQNVVVYTLTQGLVRGHWVSWNYVGYGKVLPWGGSKSKQPPLESFTGHGVKRASGVLDAGVRKQATAWRAEVEVKWDKPDSTASDAKVYKAITHYTSAQTSLTHATSCANKIKIPPPPPKVPSCSGVCGRAWGDNASGQLGNGQTSGPFAGSATPLTVSGLSNVTAIAGGKADGYAVSGGVVYAWGDDSLGQLGDNKTADSNLPVKVVGIVGKVTAVASGGDTAYAMTSTGDVYAWGANDAGQLGNGTTGGQSTTAVKVSNLSDASAIAAGGNTAYAIAAGVAYAWGDNSSGQIGNGGTGSVSSPTTVMGFTGQTVTAIAAGENNGYALVGGVVWAWGSNSNGQLGDGQSTVDLSKTSTPVQVITLTAVTAIAGGATNGYAVSGGSVYVWGDNTSGQLGDGTASAQSSTTVPTQVPHLSDIAQISASFAGTAYATTTADLNSTVLSFGSNTGGALGDGASMDQHPNAPNPVSVSVSGVTAVAGAGDPAAGGGAYVLTSAGKVKAWGLNTQGQLGIGVTYPSSPGVATPVTVSGLTSLKQIVGGGSNGYALAGNVVYGWGDASFGGLGSQIGYIGGSNTPVSIISSGNITSLAAGSSTAYALTNSGGVEAWGSNADGELGPAVSSARNDIPTTVTTLPAVTHIAAGGGSAYGLTSAGQVWAWGNDAAGQLGAEVEGDTSPTPLNVAGVSGVKAIAAGGKTAYALTTAGKVYAWGDNTYGELGDGQSPDAQPTSTVPQQVNLSSTAVAIAASGATAYALLSNGTVESWGLDSSGQLGQSGITAGMTPNPTPKVIAGLSTVTSIAAGSENGYALLSGGTIEAWGDNTSGQLGNGSTNTNSVTPVKVSNLTKVFVIGAGGSAAYALVD